MTRIFKFDNLSCICGLSSECRSKIAYILYPMDMLADWIEPAVEKYGTNIAVITGMDWQNVFSPWPAPGVPKGTPDFKGESPEFLAELQEIVPVIEKALDLQSNVERSLVGVSMSGLFTLWQWMVCDTFTNIASLSGSFWYKGFMDWMNGLTIPQKAGKAYFLLGNQESKSNVKEFNSVETNTLEIVKLLRQAGIDTEYQSVPGNHYSNPIPRLNQAFTALY